MESQRIKRLRGTIFSYFIVGSCLCYTERDGWKSNILFTIRAFDKRIAVDRTGQDFNLMAALGTQAGHCYTAVPSTFGPEPILLRFDSGVTIRIFFLDLIDQNRRWNI